MFLMVDRPNDILIDREDRDRQQLFSIRRFAEVGGWILKVPTEVSFAPIKTSHRADYLSQSIKPIHLEL